MCIYTYIHLYIFRHIDISRHMFIYTYLYIYVVTFIYIYVDLQLVCEHISKWVFSKWSSAGTLWAIECNSLHVVRSADIYIYTYIYTYIYIIHIYISYISIYHHLSIMYKVGRKCRSFKALRKQVRWSSKMRVPSCNYQPTSQRGLFLDERLVNSGSIFHQARLQLDFNLCHL